MGCCIWFQLICIIKKNIAVNLSCAEKKQKHDLFTDFDLWLSNSRVVVFLLLIHPLHHQLNFSILSTHYENQV